MICETYQIRVEGSGDRANLTTYLISPSDEIAVKKRPFILICPGGGYCFVSDREAEMFALQWNAYGYHAAVLRYSVAPEAVYPTALLELGKAMQMVKEHAAEWGVEPDKILVEGSSAGGHLAASLGMFWNKPFLAEKLGVTSEILRPAGLILNYPVISSGPYAHDESFQNLLGNQYEAKKAEMSLEHQVSADTPPTFLWHTNEDGLVPAENSLLLALEMRKHNIPVELHLYAKGGHGLALADERTMDRDGGAIEKECQSWMSLAYHWIKEVILK